MKISLAIIAYMASAVGGQYGGGPSYDADLGYWPEEVSLRACVKRGAVGLMHEITVKACRGKWKGRLFLKKDWRLWTIVEF